MVPYVPKKVDSTINGKNDSDGKDFLILTIGAFCCLVVIYYILGLGLGYIASYHPKSLDSKLALVFNTMFAETDEEKLTEDQKFARVVFARLLKALPNVTKDEDRAFRLDFMESDEINAFCLPGGRIIATKGLLNMVAKNERELSMVLGHELGHAVHYDNLQAISQAAVGSLIMVVVFGGDSKASSLFGSLNSLLSLSYSRVKERNADKFGIDLFFHVFGNTKNASDFFKHKELLVNDSQLFKLNSTHPLTSDRINALEAYIKEKY